MTKLKVLDLFSGIGGFSLGLERTGGFETVAFCEIEEFPRRVLAKHWPEIYCHRDVRTLTKESLWNGYAENAALIQLCKAMGGNLASVRAVIENIKETAARRTQTNTTNGHLSVDEALFNITAGSAPAVGRANTHFWQSITLLTTGMKSAKNTSALLGKSLSAEDFQTIIKFFVTTATWQRPSTEHALMRRAMGEDCYHDVRELTADVLRRDGISVDVICGGFPCQDISLAGEGAGLDGERSGLWSEIARLVSELRPQFVIVENVAALLGRGLERVLGDLASVGYDAEWHCIPASAVGAPHRRDRIWIVANPCGKRLEGVGVWREANRAAINDERRELGGIPPTPAFADAISRKLAQCWPSRRVGREEPFSRNGPWPLTSEPFVRRGNHGIPDRAHRLKALGNAVVPQIPELIGHAILEAERAAA